MQPTDMFFDYTLAALPDYLGFLGTMAALIAVFTAIYQAITPYREIRLIRAGNRVVAKDELSREVLGRPHETYDRSIDVHMSHLRRKLVERGVDETVLETVRGVGYRVNRA